MRFSSQISNTIESMKEMRIFVSSQEEMIETELFRCLVDKIRNVYPDSIAVHQDTVRQIVDHKLILYIESEKERNQRKKYIQELLGTNPIPEEIKKDIISALFKDELEEVSP